MEFISNIFLQAPRLVIFALAFLALIIAVILYYVDKLRGKNSDDENIVRSSDLHEDLNAERKTRNQSTLPEINPANNTNSLARRDKSFSSSIDFFVKLFKTKS